MLPNWVGDVAMATPALRTLRWHLPEARLVGVARPYLIPLLEGTAWLDHIYPWEHHGRGWLSRTRRLVSQLRSEELDLLVLLRNSLYAGVVARLSGAQRVLGYARNARSWLLTDPVALPENPQSAIRNPQLISTVDEYLHLIATLGYEPTSKRLELATRSADEAAADGVWDRLKLPPGERVMLLNTGGAYGQSKHWPDEYSVSLALRAVEEFGLTTLILCGPQERDAADRLEHSAKSRHVRSLARDDVSFGTTKAIIRRSRLLVTTDSGPRHIAAALSTPTVVLFGPIDPQLSRNYQRRTIELRVPLDCSPCGQRTCPLGHHKCMRDLTVDRVLSAVQQTLEGSHHARGVEAA
jgi:heptosyltransferase-2